MSKKREVPSTLKQILDWDIQFSSSLQSRLHDLVKNINKDTYDTTLSALEISGNGLVWLGACNVGIFTIRSSWFQNLFINILIALVVDLLVVAIIKSCARRRRPQVYVQAYSVQAIDKFSFPSGHATRAVMIAVLLITQYELFIFALPLIAWALLVCFGRLALLRHFFLDILAGVGIGWLEAQLVLVTGMWLDEATSGGWFAWVFNELPQDSSYGV